QSNMRDYADHYARICAAVELPVYVDADTGFGGINNVRQMVRAFEAAGVAGLFISDQVFPNRCGYLPGKQIVPVEQMLANINAALDARRDGDLFIAARTDAAGVEGLESAIALCQLFMEAGADMAKPMGVDTIADIKRVLREVGGPHMATLSQAAGPKARSLEELEAAGVCAPTLPAVALFAAAQGVRNVLRLLKRGNSLAPCQEHLIPLDDYYELVGLKPLLAREESYDQAAAALARKRAAEWATRVQMVPRTSIATVCLVLGVSLSAHGAARCQAASQPSQDFYKNKQIRLIIGYPVGNDYDLAGRFLARYLAKHIPGEPTIIVQNMPPAASIAAANFLYAQAPAT